jgi:hypothetical protein
MDMRRAKLKKEKEIREKWKQLVKKSKGGQKK